MSFPARLRETVVVVARTASADRYNDEALSDGLRWECPASVWPEGDQEENNIDRTTRTRRFKAVTVSPRDITAIHEIEWRGQRHTIVGEPVVVRDRNGRYHHTALRMRRFEG